MDRSPGLGFNLLAAPSHEPKAHSGLLAAFVAITVAGQQGISHASSFPLSILDFGLPILDSCFD